MSDTTITLEPSEIRDDLVKTAVNFLQNPKVMNTSLTQKQKFLKRKGLNDEEIRKACELSGAYKAHEQQIKDALPILPPSLPQYNQSGLVQATFFDKVKEYLHNFAIVSIVGYMVHKFYQKYIAPYLFGKKKKSVEKSIEDLDKTFKESVKSIQKDLAGVKNEVDKINQDGEWKTERQLNELKSDVATIKSFLLKRKLDVKQFPSVSSSFVPPSIPAWQLSSVVSADSDHDDHKNEELEDLGSGSGSSEPEHYTKSESSLEIIYTPKDCDALSQKSKDDD